MDSYTFMGRDYQFRFSDVLDFMGDRNGTVIRKPILTDSTIPDISSHVGTPPDIAMMIREDCYLFSKREKSQELIKPEDIPSED